MAGSYEHIVNDDGSFRGHALLDHMGDAWEALEECYWMIQHLSDGSAERIEQARKAAQARIAARSAPLR